MAPKAGDAIIFYSLLARNHNEVRCPRRRGQPTLPPEALPHMTQCDGNSGAPKAAMG